MKTVYGDVEPFTTKYGSVICELMHPLMRMDEKNSSTGSGVSNQSLAEAAVPVATTTMLHKHMVTEEIYHITSGRGLMTLGEERFDVTVGDTICIPSETPHCIENTGSVILMLLCCCSPAYAHDDTELLN